MPGETGELLSVREIRSYERLNLDHLGTVVIVADLKRVIGDLPKDWGRRGQDCDVGRAGAVFLKCLSAKPMASDCLLMLKTDMTLWRKTASGFSFHMSNQRIRIGHIGA